MLLLGLASGWTLAARAQEPRRFIGAVDIAVHGAGGRRDELLSAARDLVRMRRGGSFTGEMVSRSRSALLMSGKYASVRVDTVERSDTVDVSLALTAAHYVGETRIRGEFPFFESQILEVMTIYPGDVFEPDSLARQSRSIAAFLEREGFIAPNVTVTSRPGGSEGYHIVEVRIDKNAYRALDKIEIRGNERIESPRLLVRMKSWRSRLLPGAAGRFIASELQNDIKNLIKHYRRRGFAEVDIAYTIRADSSAKGRRRLRRRGEQPMIVSLSVEEGPLYDVEVEASRRRGPVGSRAMIEELALIDKGNRNHTAVRRGVRNMRERLAARGYLNPAIAIDDTTITTDLGPVRRVTIRIHRGVRTRLSSVEVTGNDAIDPRSIRRQIITGRQRVLGPEVYVPDTLARDLFAVRTHYTNRGFLNARLTEEVSWSDDSSSVAIAITIHEGVQSIVSAVTIDENDSLDVEPYTEVLTTKAGKPYRPFVADNDARRLSTAIARDGYPHVTVRHAVRFSDDSTQARVSFRVDRGPHVTVGHIICAGNLRTRRTPLVRELGVETGDNFSLPNVLEGERRIRNWEAFESVGLKTIGLKEKRDTVDLVIDVRERKPFYLRTGLGYHSDKGVFGTAELGDRNMLGLNQRGWLSGDIGFNPDSDLAELRRKTSVGAKAGIHDPRFLGLPLSATFTLPVRRTVPPNQVFGKISAGPRLDFGRQWNPALSTSLGFGYEYRKLFEQNPAVPVADSLLRTSELDARHVISVQPSIIHDSRNSFIRPTEGLYATVSTTVSKGLRGTVEDYARYRAEVRYYRTLFERFTIATTARLGHLQPFRRRYHPPSDLLFFLGGGQDVRGYPQNMLEYSISTDSSGHQSIIPRGERTSVSANLELRTKVIHNFEIPLFYDLGYLGDGIEHAFYDRLRASAGLGIRYISPIGPVGLVYAWILNPRRHEGAGELHFSVGYPF
jgi:outer membrane protein insertion porin family